MYENLKKFAKTGWSKHAGAKWRTAAALTALAKKLDVRTTELTQRPQPRYVILDNIRSELQPKATPTIDNLVQRMNVLAKWKDKYPRLFRDSTTQRIRTSDSSPKYLFRGSPFVGATAEPYFGPRFGGVAHAHATPYPETARHYAAGMTTTQPRTYHRGLPEDYVTIYKATPTQSYSYGGMQESKLPSRLLRLLGWKGAWGQQQRSKSIQSMAQLFARLRGVRISKDELDSIFPPTYETLVTPKQNPFMGAIVKRRRPEGFATPEFAFMRPKQLRVLKNIHDQLARTLTGDSSTPSHTLLP